MNSVTEMGIEIETAWQRENYRDAALPWIAEEALARHALHEKSTTNDMLRWLCEAQYVPTQINLEAKFGEPPITLFRGPRFYIEALCWLDGMPDIHQHGFSGAFTVLAGSSLHTEWTFEPEEALGEHALVGRLIPKRSELLAKGDVRQILDGSQFIHATYHLERPSVSLVVRTVESTRREPQFSYFRPGLAFSPFGADELTVRRTQVLKFLATADLDEYERALSKLLAHAEVSSALRYLDQDLKLHRDMQRFHGHVAPLTSRFPQLTTLLPLLASPLFGLWLT